MTDDVVYTYSAVEGLRAPAAVPLRDHPQRDSHPKVPVSDDVQLLAADTESGEGDYKASDLQASGAWTAGDSSAPVVSSPRFETRIWLARPGRRPISRREDQPYGGGNHLGFSMGPEALLWDDDGRLVLTRAFRGRHQIVCSGCGQTSEVPFQPDPSRPVYCEACFTPKRTRR